MGEELKPCPFCGGRASETGHIRYHEKHDGRWLDGSKVREAFFVNCMECSVSNQGVVGHQSRALAIAAWNRRTPSSELVEALREIGQTARWPSGAKRNDLALILKEIEAKAKRALLNSNKANDHG